jgi:hypothetical protein
MPIRTKAVIIEPHHLHIPDRLIYGASGRNPAVLFNGTTTTVNCGSDGSIDNLHDAALTVEAWIRTTDDDCVFLEKGDLDAGWALYYSGTELLFRINAVADALCDPVTADPIDGKWHHIAGTYDDGGDRMARLYLDGILIDTSAASGGAVVADAGFDLYFGSRDAGSIFLDGIMRWVRLSNNIRYVANFTPSRWMPAADVNTVEQWAMNEGTGVTAAATVAGANDGTITDGEWIYV